MSLGRHHNQPHHAIEPITHQTVVRSDGRKCQSRQEKLTHWVGQDMMFEHEFILIVPDPSFVCLSVRALLTTQISTEISARPSDPTTAGVDPSGNKGPPLSSLQCDEQRNSTLSLNAMHSITDPSWGQNQRNVWSRTYRVQVPFRRPYVVGYAT